jgi:hypothetical protein
MRKTNYLNNKDILLEIHKSKNSFCTYLDAAYNQFDIIVTDKNQITNNLIQTAKTNRSKRLDNVDLESIPKTDLIFRIMTFDHIPDQPGRKKNPKTVADRKIKLNFPPFQHWKFNENNELICIGKSHWTGDLEHGQFSMTHGIATDKLALMWIKLCERYATRGNVRGYTYNDEMRGQAILQLAQIGLQFDESKSQNPFAYYTAAVTNSFVRVINLEKRNQNIRDDILTMNDMNPSYTRQANDEWEVALKREKEFQENNTF